MSLFLVSIVCAFVVNSTGLFDEVPALSGSGHVEESGMNDARRNANTHYQPQRKSASKEYEVFGFGEGSNHKGVLIGNGIDVRHELIHRQRMTVDAEFTGESDRVEHFLPNFTRVRWVVFRDQDLAFRFFSVKDNKLSELPISRERLRCVDRNDKPVANAIVKLLSNGRQANGFIFHVSTNQNGECDLYTSVSPEREESWVSAHDITTGEFAERKVGDLTRMNEILILKLGLGSKVRVQLIPIGKFNADDVVTAKLVDANGHPRDLNFGSDFSVMVDDLKKQGLYQIVADEPYLICEKKTKGVKENIVQFRVIQDSEQTLDLLVLKGKPLTLSVLGQSGAPISGIRFVARRANISGAIESFERLPKSIESKSNELGVVQFGTLAEGLWLISIAEKGFTFWDPKYVQLNAASFNPGAREHPNFGIDIAKQQLRVKWDLENEILPKVTIWRTRTLSGTLSGFKQGKTYRLEARIPVSNTTNAELLFGSVNIKARNGIPFNLQGLPPGPLLITVNSGNHEIGRSRLIPEGTEDVNGIILEPKKKRSVLIRLQGPTVSLERLKVMIHSADPNVAARNGLGQLIRSKPANHEVVFNEIPEGDYLIRLWVPKESTVVPTVGGKRIVVKSTDEESFELSYDVAKFRYEGQVVNRNGRPLVNAHVELFAQTESGELSEIVKADSKGKFLIKYPREVSFRVRNVYYYKVGSNGTKELEIHKPTSSAGVAPNSAPNVVKCEREE